MTDNETPDFGRAWAVNTTCCSKPVGCTNMSDQCLMRNHPWKRRNNTAEQVREDVESLAEMEAEIKERFKDIA